MTCSTMGEQWERSALNFDFTQCAHPSRGEKEGRRMSAVAQGYGIDASLIFPLDVVVQCKSISTFVAFLIHTVQHGLPLRNIEIDR